MLETTENALCEDGITRQQQDVIALRAHQPVCASPTQGIFPDAVGRVAAPNSGLREWKIDPLDDRLNPNGSGISLGHPVGATGARILATLSRELHRRDGRYGLETLCIGGGQGIAAIFEAVR